jgi:hypothetical protein
MPDRTSERGMKSLFAQKQCSALDVEAQPDLLSQGRTPETKPEADAQTIDRK